jgi:protein subunit release factor B
MSNSENRVKDRMLKLGIREEDIQESFVRSTGPGGQNVNKVATCVCLYHGPTGIGVKCQRHRTQAMNRLWARKILLDKIEEQQRQKVAALNCARAKQRRQHRRRSKATKEKILEKKKHRSQQKKNRQKNLLNQIQD